MKVIQSVLLMSFWHPNTNYRTGPWHWTGVAISLSQALRLHLEGGSAEQNSILEGQCLLRKRIWWCCMLRDRWLSFVLQRPLRINSDDCNITMASTGEVWAEIRPLSLETKTDFMPVDSYQLTACWTILLKLTSVVGEIMSCNFRPNGAKLTLDQIEKFERDISGHSTKLTEWAKDTQRVTECHILQLQLYVE